MRSEANKPDMTAFREPVVIRDSWRSFASTLVFYIVIVALCLWLGRGTANILKPIFLVLFGLVVTIMHFRHRLTLTANMLSYRDLFTTYSIRREDIAEIQGLKERPALEGQSQRWDNKYITFIPRNQHETDVEVPHEYLSDERLKAWLLGLPEDPPTAPREKPPLLQEWQIKDQQRAADTEALCKMAEKVTALGGTKAERRANFIRSNFRLQILALVSAFITLVLFLLPFHSPLLFWISVIPAVLVLFLSASGTRTIFWFRATQPGSPLNSTPLFCPGPVMALQSLFLLLLACRITSTTGTESFLIPAVCIAVVLHILLSRSVMDFRIPRWRSLTGFLFLIVFSYSTLRLANVCLDTHTHRQVAAEITAINQNTNNIQIRLPAGMKIRQAHLHVDMVQARDLKPGDKMCVRTGPGALGISWLTSDGECGKIR